MPHPTLPFVARVLLCALLLAPLSITACGAPNCDDLAAICELCPSDGLGPAAKESCLRAVATDDDATCEDKLDKRSYAAFGCK